MRPVSVEFGKRKQASDEDDNQRRPDMATVYVKCKPGRRHYYQGRVIPTDKFVPVDPNDPVMYRAIYHWQDLEVEGGVGEGAKPGDPIEDRPPGGGHISGQPIRDTINPQRARRPRPGDPGPAPQHQQPATPKE